MNDFETALQQKLRFATSNERAQALRCEVLAKVDQELRSRRRDRLAKRIVFSGLFLGIVGNFAIKQQEGTRTAHWFTQESSTTSELLAEAEQPGSTPNLFDEYLFALYPSAQSPWGGDRAARSAQAHAMAAWIDEFAKTGHGF